MMIATWFVADSKEEASSFAQVTGDSSTLEFQSVYWRCIAVFFATSKRQNPTARHVFFTNTSLPAVDRLDFSNFFKEMEVETVKLPITFRLDKQVTGAWGNQFYILDIIRYLAINPMADTYIVLDSDCVWTASADLIEVALAEKSCLLYTLGTEAYELRQKINGVTRQEMAQLTTQVFPDVPSPSAALGIPYHGGEIFAATHRACVAINQDINALWRQRLIAETGASGFLEEAHFLSIIYKHRGYEPYSANCFIKRMWTGFSHNNMCENDIHLPLWHLPAEKKTGFKKIFRAITEKRFPQNILARNRMLLRAMGVPRKGTGKFISDFCSKIIEKARPLLAR